MIHKQINKREHKHTTKVCDEVSASVYLSNHALECHIIVRSEVKHRDKTHTWLLDKLKASPLQLTQKLVREEVKILT